MVQTRSSTPSGRVYNSTILPRQKKLRNIMNQTQKVRRRVSANPEPSVLRQETMTQMGFVFGKDNYSDEFDAENQPLSRENTNLRRHEDRRKRRRTLGDSPASSDLLSRKNQSTLTQIGFVEPVVWHDPELDEADEEEEEYIKREKSIPVWEDETAEPKQETQDEEFQYTQLRYSNETNAIRRDDREVGDSDEEDDLEVEDNLDLGNRQDEADEVRDVEVSDEESTVAQREKEIGDSDQESDAEDLEQDDSDQNSRGNLKSNSLEALSTQPTQLQIRSSIGPPTTPRKKRYEIPDSDAESEDISPGKITPIRALSSQLTQTTPSGPIPRYQNLAKANPAVQASKSTTANAPVMLSQETTVDLSQHMRSDEMEAQKTTPGKSLYQATNTSPFVLRPSQLLTESQMLPASLMGTVPMPPCWLYSDNDDEEEDEEVSDRISQGRYVDEDDEDDENDEL